MIRLFKLVWDIDCISDFIVVSFMICNCQPFWYTYVGDDCVAINGGTININITRVICGPGHGIR